MPRPAWNLLPVAAAALASLVAAPGARGQLAESNVLVVYDSRIPDSLLVAEHYAGSAKVPGGSGLAPGRRPGVRVVDLAALPGGGMSPPATDISYPDFISRFRNPLRAHLTAQGISESVRCLVLTKGLPHRVMDHDNFFIGDNPSGMGGEFTSGDASAASLDIELALLWQNLDQGEVGGFADSRADGMIVNPYARQTLPVHAWPSASIRTAKSFIAVPGWTGGIWQTAGGGATRLTPGDMYLVTRLDGHTVAHVSAMIDRAALPAIPVDAESAAIVLDESLANGVADAGENGELDNQGPPALRAGDDFELTRDRLLADGRMLPANLRYDQSAGAANFLVGPLLGFDGEGMVLAAPVVLLGHEGNNHAGPKPGDGPGPDPSAGSLFAESFNYAPGAIFNTIESYNCRAFGGLGTIIGQEQAADFLAAGGTFALGNVWEPFSISIPDNSALISNFLLGRLTWAEAAYTALPALSWQQVVLGDPLARVVLSRHDLTLDQAVGAADLYRWHEQPAAGDLNRSGLADDADRRLLEAAVRGHEAVFLASGQR
ncbi:MAG TPA: hypothetical protein VD963_02015 [Phycisphaerales bacterium]|nr:hypothetical protein [Phycisphaerales bacterium]